MIKQIIISFAFIMLMVNSGMACDACGCSVSTGGIGLLAQMNYNFVGVRYQHTVFRSIDRYDKNHQTIDQFNQFELWGRYYLGSRFQLAAVVPYLVNDRSGINTLPVNLSGIGDISVSGIYSLIKTSPEENKPGHQLDIGAGVKLPTGKYDPIQDDKIPDNMNLGTNSFDFTAQTTYNLKFINSGITANAFYRFNTENQYGYQFGNRLTGSIYGYWKKDVKALKFVPFGGFYLEAISSDRLYGTHPHGTGGNGLFGTVGLDVYIGKMLVGATFQQPFQQNYSEGEVEISPRVSANVAYLF